MVFTFERNRVLRRLHPIAMAALVLLGAQAATAACPPTPRQDCRVGKLSTLHISDRRDDRFDQLRFDMRYAERTTFAEFGNPVGGDDYQLCLYGNGVLAGTVAIPPGGNCAAGGCWQTGASAYAYKGDRDSGHGITTAGLRAGENARTRVWLRGAGRNVPSIPLPLAEPVVAQLQNDDGNLCFSASFSGREEVLENGGKRLFFRGVSNLDALPTPTPTPTGPAVPTPTPTRAPQVYDIEPDRSAEPGRYVPRVGQLNVLDMSVHAVRGGPLHLGHPIVMSAELNVDGEPFEATLWFGLQDEDGDFCVVNHIAFSHLGAMYEAADRANIAAAAPGEDEGVTPSLEDCSDGQTCPAGEECVAFEERVPQNVQIAPDDTDIRNTIPQTPIPGPAPEELEYETVRSYVCATQSYAASVVARAKTVPGTVTPADLAGSVAQRHVIGATDQLPEACAALVGASSVTGWLAFDPEGSTEYAGRPAYDPNDPLLDEPGLDEETQGIVQERRAFRQQMPETIPAPEVLPDPGLNVAFRDLRVGSSVMLLDPEDRPAGDFHVSVDYSLDGEPSPAQEAALEFIELPFDFTMRPVGAARAGCEPPLPAPSLDAEYLQIVPPSEPQVVEPPALGTALDESFPLYLTPDVRARVLGDWSCWDQFEIAGCVTPNIDQSGAFGTSDDCTATSVIVVRNVAPEDAEPVAPPAPFSRAKIPRIGDPGCSDSLFRAYADNMKKHHELENQVHIDEYYTYDYLQWVWGSLQYPGVGNGFTYITNAARQQAYYNYVKSYLTECEALGGQKCWTTWGAKNSPWNIDINNYTSQLLPYFWNQWNPALGSYPGFKSNPQQFTRNGFNFECAGIYNGSVCSEINYDLARVPELASRIRDVLVNDRVSNPLAAKMSPNGATRCLRRAYPALRRMVVDDRGRVTNVPDDDAFYTQYLARACEKGKYKAEADRIWAEIASKCTYVAKPFADSGAGIYAGRFVPELYRTYDTGFKAGLKGVIEGGIVNDYIVATPLQQFKLIFGAQGRIYLESDPKNDIVGGINVHDIFKTWMLGNFYSDILSSNVEAGFHVLTHDIWKVSFKLPTGEFTLPDPPELSKEVEKCKYLWKVPMPFRIELCGSVGGKLDLTVQAKVLKTGIAGVDPAKADWPGVSGTITPGAAITNKGRAGVDVLVASAGLVLTIDPTIGVYIPIEVGAKWNLAMPALRQLDYNLSPYVKTTLELKALGGQLLGYTRWKIGSTSESEYPIPGAQWDPLDIGNLLGQEWVLVKHSWDVRGTRNF